MPNNQANEDRIVEVKQIVKRTAIASVTNYARARLQRGEPAFQILDLLIPRERKIRSIVGGMETSLGTTLWQPLAKNLASANGFDVVNQNLQTPTNMPAILQSTIQIITDGRLGRNVIYTGAECHRQIKSICQQFLQTPIDNFVNAPTGFGVDIWLRKDNVNYFFDTKTVQSNIGGFTRYFTQIMNWYAYFYSRYPNGNAESRIVFPYNPYDGNYWENAIGRGFPIEPNSEAWVEDEFWNFCSGIENTFELIKTTFREIAESGELQAQLDELFA